MANITRLEKLQRIEQWSLNKPRSNAGWAEDVKSESLDVKFDHQLEEMERSHIEKRARARKQLEIFESWPDVARYQLTQQFSVMFEESGNPETVEGKTLSQWIDDEFEQQHTYYRWKVAKLDQSIERIVKERELRGSGYLTVLGDEVIKGGDKRRRDIDRRGSRVRSPIGTTYYIDADSGNNANDGLSPGAAWDTLDQFTENARSAGDVAILKGGCTDGYDDGTDLNFTSDGTIASPITITADYGNAFSNHYQSAQTYTPVFGSKTMTASASIVDIAAGEVVYVTDDGATSGHCYEVASVSGTTLTLYLPYKGSQSGPGHYLVSMRGKPHWNDAVTADFQWNFDTDDCWSIRGLLIRGTDPNGQVEIDSSYNHEFVDCTFLGNGNGDKAIAPTDDQFFTQISKCRSGNNGGLFYIASASDTFGEAVIKDSYNSGPGTGVNSGFLGFGSGAENVGRYDITIIECENDSTLVDLHTATPGVYRVRNMRLNAPTPIVNDSEFGSRLYFEDYSGTVGDNRAHPETLSGNTNTLIFQSDTSTTRSGGSNKSIKVTPTTNLGTVWSFSKLMLLELPIYATTDSKTYTVYFKSSGTGNWTNDPTASELWIELEAWGHASNNYRKITKSTGTCDFNGTTDWVSLAVTVAPSQSGVAYLRCWYAKTKEAGSNIFYVDPVPVIT